MDVEDVGATARGGAREASDFDRTTFFRRNCIWFIELRTSGTGKGDGRYAWGGRRETRMTKKGREASERVPVYSPDVYGCRFGIEDYA